MTSNSPDELERQLEHDRVEIQRTVEAIGSRLSPGQLLDQAMSYLRTGGSEMGSNVARSVKENPLPLILTGVGLAWLIKSSASSNAGPGRHRSVDEYVQRSNAAELARTAGAEVAREPGETEEGFQARVTEAKAKALSLRREVGETADAFRQRVEDFLQRAEETASGLVRQAKSTGRRGGERLAQQAQSMRQGAERAQSRAADLYHSEPLVAGALGIAAGALIAALVPPTRPEKRALGEYGETVRHEVGEAASTAVERGKAAAKEGARAAIDEARETVRGGQSAPQRRGDGAPA